MPFGAFKDVGERRSLDHERSQRKQQESMGQWQYVNAIFTAPNTDLVIQHTLISSNPEFVRYLVVRQGAAAVVFQDLTPTRVPWTKGIIRLQSSLATSARLLLFVESPSPAPAAPLNA